MVKEAVAVMVMLCEVAVSKSSRPEEARVTTPVEGLMTKRPPTSSVRETVNAVERAAA